jgi:hypothetical protein
MDRETGSLRRRARSINRPERRTRPSKRLAGGLVVWITIVPFKPRRISCCHMMQTHARFEARPMTNLSPILSSKIFRERPMIRRILGVLVTAAFIWPAEAHAQSPTFSRRPTAFVDVTVLPMDSDRVLPHRTVIVESDRIVSVSPADKSAIPAGALRIDGRGKYLMPGLIDSHVHVRNIGDLLLYVANGVTTVRNMRGYAYHLRWRDSIANGTLFGPTLYTTSNYVEGDSAFSEGSLIVRSADAAERVVTAMAREGYDFVKVYVMLDTAGFDGIIAAGKRHGLRVVGHVPWKVGMRHALAQHIASIEHAENIYQTWFGSKIDPSGLADMARATHDAGVAVVPTLTVFRSVVLTSRAAPILDSLLRRPDFIYVEPSVRNAWKEDAQEFATNNRDDQPTLLHRFQSEYQFFQEITRALHDAHVTVLAGTDTPAAFELPGKLLIDELEIYVAIGFTPYEALSSATRVPGRFLDQQGNLGTVEAGKRADLLLLDANPRDDISNLSLRSGVMLRGRWFPESNLRAALNQLASVYRNSGWRSNGGYAPRGYERLQAALEQLLAGLANGS